MSVKGAGMKGEGQPFHSEDELVINRINKRIKQIWKRRRRLKVSTVEAASLKVIKDRYRRL